MKIITYFLIFIFVSTSSLISRTQDLMNYHPQRIIIKFKANCVLFSDLKKVVPKSQVPNNSSSIPEKFSLQQNYPNPFNPSTKIRFGITKSDLTTLTIYDALGKEVKKFVYEFLNPGSYEIILNADNYSNGIYYYKLSSGTFIKSKSMIVLK